MESSCRAIKLSVKIHYMLSVLLVFVWLYYNEHTKLSFHLCTECVCVRVMRAYVCAWTCSVVPFRQETSFFAVHYPNVIWLVYLILFPIFSLYSRNDAPSCLSLLCDTNINLNGRTHNIIQYKYYSTHQILSCSMYGKLTFRIESDIFSAPMPDGEDVKSTEMRRKKAHTQHKSNNDFAPNSSIHFNLLTRINMQNRNTNTSSTHTLSLQNKHLVLSDDGFVFLYTIICTYEKLTVCWISEKIDSNTSTVKISWMWDKIS